MKTSFPMKIRDGGSSLIITVPTHVQGAGFKVGDYVQVTIEHFEEKKGEIDGQRVSSKN